MRMYNYARSGPIRGRRISNRQMMRMASRVASFASPSKIDDLFARLRARQDRVLGPNYMEQRLSLMPDQMNMASTPRPRPGVSLALDPMARGAAALPASPRVAAALGDPPDATPTPFRYVGDFKQEWVDDRTWKRTLPEMLGMGILTQEQMKNLSINNILSKFQFEGGTEQQRLELGYFFQRAVLEGYLRGVDVLALHEKDIQNNRLPFTFRLWTREQIDRVSPGAAGYAFENPGNNHEVVLDKGMWEGMSDMNKYWFFMHEFTGHKIMSAPDRYGPNWEQYKEFDFMGGGPAPGQPRAPGEPPHPDSYYVNDHYDQFVGHVFNKEPNSRDGVNSPVDYWADGGKPLVTPMGMPQIVGNVGDPNQPPGTVVIPDVNVQMNKYNIAPPQVTPWSGQYMGMPASGGPSGGPEGMSKTPVAGMLPQMANLSSFSMGLQDIVSRASGTLNGLGALLNDVTGGRK